MVIASIAGVMDASGNLSRFEELPPAEQHTVETYIDELSRRDTLVDQAITLALEDEPRDSRIYAIPSAELDLRGAMAVLRGL